MPELYGIDLGTRNTAVECKGARLATESGGTIPSAVAYDAYSSRIDFGEEALAHLRNEDPKELDRWSVGTSFKTSLDSDLPFVDTPSGSKTAAQVLADYFRCLVQYAERRGFPPLRDAVLSIPVGFSSVSRSRLLGAARSAGIEVHGVVSESTAAYLRIAHDLGSAQRVAVVDWGAGTLDVSVLHIVGSGSAGAVVEEQACIGSTAAGDTIDLAIYEWLASRARQSGRAIDPVDKVPLGLLRRAMNASERAKIDLSDRRDAEAQSEIALREFTDRKFAKFTLTASDLLALSAPARDAAFHVLEDAISSAGLSIGQFDRIIFVGGCTGILGFREQAQQRYKQAAVFPSNPEWVVAGGALEVAHGHAQYESVQEFGCILDDGYFLPISHSPRFDGSSCVVSVAATESTNHASLVFADRQAGRTAVAGTMSVPLLGHMGEPVNIETTMQRDLTVRIEAWSQCGDRTKDARSINIANTRFRFRVQ
jgi:molecular chaperone DnaK